MHFASLHFLGFFCAVFAVYWLLPWHRVRMLWLLVASCVFYMSWNPLFITLILFSASIDYLAALQLDKTTSVPWRRFLLCASIGTNLGLLGFFKYTNFIVGTAYSACNLVGLDFAQPVFKIALPLAISFYTFETISYVVDVYRGRIKPIRDIQDYALYILFFPHLIAGPIVRPKHFLPQLARRKRFDWDRIQLGSRLFLLGFVKKTVIADHLANVVNPFFNNPDGYGTQATWLVVLGYAMQIYGDFSGYSDMGIGAAHLLGFKLPANFNMPYLAANISEFWRRWHISLSTWLRDYLYVPLGGNRHGTWRTYCNLLITMLLGGLWHGANWTFIAWGLYHGVLLCIHRLCSGIVPAFQGVLRPFGVAATFLSVCVGWVFFRAQTFSQAGTILAHLFWPSSGAALAPEAACLVLTCASAMILGHFAGSLVRLDKLERRLPEPVVGAVMAGFLVLAILLQPLDTHPFIYFQF
jgi:alginate O-acetyltransferase complex protein AlgI